MEIRNATRADCPAIAELALMAGEGIPAYFWEQSRKAGQTLLEVGVQNAALDTENFSWRNTRLALIDNTIAGMLLAYRLPAVDPDEDLAGYPEFIRPLIELEMCVPESFYINMLATCPAYRNRSVGTRLMAQVYSLAGEAGCALSSLEVFDENTGALRFYQRLGYEVIEQRPVIPHACHPSYGGDSSACSGAGLIFLRVRQVNRACDALLQKIVTPAGADCIREHPLLQEPLEESIGCAVRTMNQLLVHYFRCARRTLQRIHWS